MYLLGMFCVLHVCFALHASVFILRVRAHMPVSVRVRGVSMKERVCVSLHGCVRVYTCAILNACVQLRTFLY